MRLKKEQRSLHGGPERGVTFITPSIFRATVPVPATAPLGAYRGRDPLLSGGVELARVSTAFEVSKVGFEQAVAQAGTRSWLVLWRAVTAAISLAFGCWPPSSSAATDQHRPCPLPAAPEYRHAAPARSPREATLDTPDPVPPPGLRPDARLRAAPRRGSASSLRGAGAGGVPGAGGCAPGSRRASPRAGLVGYGVVIASFLGGIRWGVGLQPSRRRAPHQPVRHVGAAPLSWHGGRCSCRTRTTSSC